MQVRIEHLPIIDWELGAKLVGNKKDVAEDILKLLIKDLTDNIKLLNQLYISKNISELQKEVHKLHGALCYCGTPRIKSIVTCLELEIKNNIMTNLSSLLNQLNFEVKLLLEHYSHSSKTTRF